MESVKIIAEWVEYFAFALAIWNVIKLLFTMSANAGTRISKKVGTSNEGTDGAIEYSNRAMKRQMIRIAIFGGIGLLCLLITYM